MDNAGALLSKDKVLLKLSMNNDLGKMRGEHKLNQTPIREDFLGASTNDVAED